MSTVVVRYIGYRPETGCFTCMVFKGSLQDNSGVLIEEQSERKLKKVVESTLKKIVTGRSVSVSYNKGTREITYKF